MIVHAMEIVNVMVVIVMTSHKSSDAASEAVLSRHFCDLTFTLEKLLYCIYLTLWMWTSIHINDQRVMFTLIMVS